MPDINFTEASKQARSLKNHFRAFEKLEEVLAAAAGAEGVVAQVQARLKQVEDAIVQADTDKELAERGLAETKDLAQSERDRLAAEHRAAAEVGANRLALLQADIAEVERALVAREAEADETVEALVAREAEARAKAEAAEAALAALRASLPG